LLLSAAVLAQDQEQPTAEEQAEMEAYFQKVAEPGSEHEMLASLKGTWTQKITLWPAPGVEPMVFEGTAENKMILGGRFLESRSESGEGEMFTQSLTLYGYDNRYAEFTIVGFDTWGTYFVTAQGPMQEDGETVVMHGTDFDPLMNFEQEYDMVLKFVDEDTYKSEVIFYNEEMTGGEERFKMLEVVNTRVK
jgi:hypothetical protein